LRAGGRTGGTGRRSDGAGERARALRANPGSSTRTATAAGKGRAASPTLREPRRWQTTGPVRAFWLQCRLAARRLSVALGGANMDALLGIVWALVLLLVAHVVVEAYYYQARLGPPWSATWASAPAAPTSASAAAALGGRRRSGRRGGVFAQAGLRAGDVLPGVSRTDLFKLLHRHAGGRRSWRSWTAERGRRSTAAEAGVPVRRAASAGAGVAT